VVEAFFPSGCEPGQSRRQFLILGAALMGVSGSRQASAQSNDGIDVIRAHATTPRDPWVVSHGLRAMGRDFTIQGGRSAVDFLLEEHFTSVTVNGRTMLAVPREVEIHPNMFLKTLLEAGVPFNYRFVHKGQRRTVADVVEGAKLLLRPGQEPPSEMAWTITALTRTISPVRARWTNAWGEPVDLDAVVGRALEALERDSAPVSDAMKQGRPLSARAPVHELTCGGTHLIYSLVAAAHAGYAGNGRGQRLREQVDLLVWRLGADVDLIDRFYAAQRATSFASLMHLDAKLKLLGHAEECLALATRRKVVVLSEAQQARRQTAIAETRRLLGDVERLDLSKLRPRQFEAYQQIVGDVCHARHGLTLT
jgi:hypothetical protein